ncbi:MAG: sigma-70 family RNA polymerase sigma factor [Polyangiaceae bacterium]
MSPLAFLQPRTKSVPTPTLRELFDNHAAFVVRVLRRMGVLEADLDDVLQEVFVVVHRKIEQFDGRCKVETWLFGIAFRVAADHRRARGRRRETAVDELPEVPTPHGPEHLAQSAELQRWLMQALDKLDDEKRAVFVLYELEGMSMNDVADAVSVPLQTAYSRLHSARDTVRKTIERAYGGAP